ncbi:MAG: tetratricopeptide repeat protein [Oscillospiraceae bacterium]|nr:tetratricopeptide repeat protein [Oscillospiraceae bacterium]
MNEQEIQAILDEIRSKITGNTYEDMLFLQSQVNEYSKSEAGKAVADEITKFALSLLPQEQKDYMNRALYIGERRLDQVYAEARKLMNEHLNDKALTLTRQLYDKIMEEFAETETERFFCFRNLLESNLYQIMYHPEKKLLHAPFDFSRYLLAHAFNLIELRRAPEAIPVLQEAIRFNPTNPDPRFELAEVYKLLGDKEQLLQCIRDTLPFCTTPYGLSRCYTNMGYYCVESKDYEAAVHFYFESLLFVDHPAVPGELKHVSLLMGKRITAPTREEVLATFKKYDIQNGPSEYVVHTATQLANQAMGRKAWEEACYYLGVLAGTTHDEEAERTLRNCEEHLRLEKEGLE